jgi:hypothetical protein
MKISELLVEAGPSTYVPASPTSPIVVPTSPSVPAPSAPSTPPTRSGPDPDTRERRRSKVERGRTVKRGINYLQDLIQNRRNEPRYNDLARSSITKRLGGAMRILRLMGYADLVMSYWTDEAACRDALAEQVKQGQITEKEAQDDYNNWRRETLGVLVATIAASSFIKYALRTALGLRWLVRGLGLAGSLATGGLSVAALIASEAAMTAFLMWASSDAGKKTIAEWIAFDLIGDIGPADALGYLVTGPADKIKEIISKASKQTNKTDKPQIANKPDAGKPDTNKPTPNQAAQPSNKWKPAEPGAPDPNAPGRYSQYTSDPELKKALQAAGL